MTLQFDYSVVICCDSGALYMNWVIIQKSTKPIDKYTRLRPSVKEEDISVIIQSHSIY